MLFADLHEVKTILEIDPEDTQEDKNLGFFIRYASAMIEKFLNRPGYLKQERTWYMGGSGTTKLRLPHYPIYRTPTPRAFVDESALSRDDSDAFASTSELTYGTDFALGNLRDDGTSHSGLLMRINAFRPKPHIRQRGFLSPFVGDSFENIKLIYTAGWTSDTLPEEIVMATIELVAKIRFLFPLGLPITGDSYEERNINIDTKDKDWLLSQVKQRLYPYRNVRF